MRMYVIHSQQLPKYLEEKFDSKLILKQHLKLIKQKASVQHKSATKYRWPEIEPMSTANYINKYQ